MTFTELEYELLMAGYSLFEHVMNPNWRLRKIYHYRIENKNVVDSAKQVKKTI